MDQATADPDSLPDRDLFAHLVPGVAPAAQLVAVRILHGRGRGVEETAALAGAEGTAEIVRLNVLAGLVRMHTPRAREAVGAYYRARPNLEERGRVIDLLGSYGDGWDLGLLEAIGAEEGDPDLRERALAASSRLGG